MGDAQLCARLEPAPWLSASFCDCEAEESLPSSLWPCGCAALAQHSPLSWSCPQLWAPMPAWENWPETPEPRESPEDLRVIALIQVKNSV